jgi:hypothetical protein
LKVSDYYGMYHDVVRYMCGCPLRCKDSFDGRSM